MYYTPIASRLLSDKCALSDSWVNFAVRRGLATLALVLLVVWTPAPHDTHWRAAVARPRTTVYGVVMSHCLSKRPFVINARPTACKEELDGYGWQGYALPSADCLRQTAAHQMSGQPPPLFRLRPAV